MKSTEFCYWLQGLFELSNPQELNLQQTTAIKAHLAMVFKHEIDPSYGDTIHQRLLDGLHKAATTQHDGLMRSPSLPVAHDHIHPNDVMLRC